MVSKDILDKLEHEMDYKLAFKVANLMEMEGINETEAKRRVTKELITKNQEKAKVTKTKSTMFTEKPLHNTPEKEFWTKDQVPEGAGVYQSANVTTNESNTKKGKGKK